MALQLCQVQPPLTSASTTSPTSSHGLIRFSQCHNYHYKQYKQCRFTNTCCDSLPRRSNASFLVLASEEKTQQIVQDGGGVDDQDDLVYVQQIKRVLELLKKNRDMLFNEVKLTVMIEDPREVERRRLLGIEDPDTPTRNDLVEVLEQVNEGKVPEKGVALRMLAEEMINWPNLEVEAPKKTPSKSLYAKATDTGINPQQAARILKMDWDSAAEIEDSDVKDESDVPPAVGYGALYLVTAFPVIIGISVVLILFYNSLQ